MYNLNTLEGRLRALADRHTLAIHTEWNGAQYVNMHTLKQHGWLLGRLDFACFIKARSSVGVREFDDGCEALGFEGTVRDNLRMALFGNAPVEDVMDTKPTIRQDAGKASAFFACEGGQPC